MTVRILVVLGSVAVTCLIYLASFLQFITCGVVVGDKVLTVANGHFAKQITRIPYHKIQQMEYRQGPLGRHFGYAMGFCYVLAQLVNSVHAVSYFKTEIYAEIKKKMLIRKGNRD